MLVQDDQPEVGSGNPWPEMGLQGSDLDTILCFRLESWLSRSLSQSIFGASLPEQLSF